MSDTVYKIALAGLMHDVGKLRNISTWRDE